MAGWWMASRGRVLRRDSGGNCNGEEVEAQAGMTTPFKDIRKALTPDGSLRDIYIHDVTEEDWAQFITLAPQLTDGASFSWGDKAVDLPPSFPEIAKMQKTDPTILSLDVGGGNIACHFFMASEIELDFDPRDYQDQEKWESLYAFVEALADALGKKAIITHENAEDEVILDVEPRQEDAEVDDTKVIIYMHGVPLPPEMHYVDLCALYDYIPNFPDDTHAPVRGNGGPAARRQTPRYRRRHGGGSAASGVPPA